MIKTIGLVGILCAAAIFGMTWARQNFQRTEKAPTAVLQAAATTLEFSHRRTGTYAGAARAGDARLGGPVPVLHRVRRSAHRRSRRHADLRRLPALVDLPEQLRDLRR